VSQTLRSWAQVARQTNADEFARRYPGPFLIALDAVDPAQPAV
jgi:hypothetical protein